MQKPMTEREVFDRTKMLDIADHAVWMEMQGWGDHGALLFVCEVGWDDDEECFNYWMCGCDREYTAHHEAYGKTWRCWSSRPTGEERKAAKWEDEA